jgi:elongation of very long chain fatty acids protein 6
MAISPVDARAVASTAQLFHTFPALAFLYPFEWENTYIPSVLNTMQTSQHVLPTSAVVLYLLFCYYGQRYMKSRTAFDLTAPLVAWNLFLSAFSFYGTIRTVPHLLHRIATESFRDTICSSAYESYGTGAVGLATSTFILSKIPELLDTVFIVLRKKDLLFLHWYHHVTVLVFCWNSYVTESSAGLYFIAMNYTVHAIMYLYFGLATLRRWPKWFPAGIVTAMQIAQMVIGTGIVAACLYFKHYGEPRYVDIFTGQLESCLNSQSNLWVGGIIYASYLYLFAEFAVGRYCSSRRPKVAIDEMNNKKQ